MAIYWQGTLTYSPCQEESQDELSVLHTKPSLFMVPESTIIETFFIQSLPLYHPTNSLWPALTNQSYTKHIHIYIYTNQSKLYNLEISFTWNGLTWELWVGNFCKKWLSFVLVEHILDFYQRLHLSGLQTIVWIKSLIFHSSDFCWNCLNVYIQEKWNKKISTRCSEKYYS